MPWHSGFSVEWKLKLEALLKLKMDQQVFCPEMAKISLRNESLRYVKDFGVRHYVHSFIFMVIFCASSHKSPRVETSEILFKKTVFSIPPPLQVLKCFQSVNHYWYHTSCCAKSLVASSLCSCLWSIRGGRRTFGQTLMLCAKSTWGHLKTHRL